MKLLLVSNRLDFETVILSSCDNIQDFLFLRCIVGSRFPYKKLQEALRRQCLSRMLR